MQNTASDKVVACIMPTLRMTVCLVADAALPVGGLYEQ